MQQAFSKLIELVRNLVQEFSSSITVQHQRLSAMLINYIMDADELVCRAVEWSFGLSCFNLSVKRSAFSTVRNTYRSLCIVTLKRPQNYPQQAHIYKATIFFKANLVQEFLQRTFIDSLQS